jgi:hypothetical protein
MRTSWRCSVKFKEMPSAVLATAIQDGVTNAKHYFFPAALQGIQKSRFSGKPLTAC